MQLFLGDIQGDRVVLRPDEVKHATKALRKQPGDEIVVIDGKGNLFQCRITHTTKSVVEAEILSRTQNFGNLNYELHVAIAPTKNIDRYEWFLEKATELGITSIYPIITHHSERKVIKHDRLERVLISATKQSLKGTIPILHPLMKWKEFLNIPFDGDRFIAHCAEGAKQEFAIQLDIHKSTLVCIGPEGDFDEQEVKAALNQKFRPVQLGESRLRTETAGVAAVAAMYHKALT